MDQLPLDFKMTMLIADYSELLDLLETDREKWQWLIDEINKQISEQLTPQQAVDLERAIIDLKGQKAGVVKRKMNLQGIASELKEKLNNPKQSEEELQENSAERIDVKQKLTEIESEIRDFNLQIGGKRKLLISIQNHLQGKKNAEDMDNAVITALIEMKDEYDAFAGDHTRISSMRTMAAQIAKKLENVINLSN